jgi:cytochrome c oxidase cbb3-type subunit 3
MSTTNPKESDGADVVIADHRYDGIREYDNPMPGWWTALFWATAIFGVIYIIGVNVGFVDEYGEDLNQSLEELAAVRAEYENQNPTSTIDEATLAAIVADPDRIAAGKVLFAGQCAACHAADGGGLIGPNMTDAYYIHGGSNMDLFEVIRVGVPEKGMAPWESVYTSDERASLVAFIRSLEGTTPASPKDPQGELYVRN